MRSRLVLLAALALVVGACSGSSSSTTTTAVDDSGASSTTTDNGSGGGDGGTTTSSTGSDDDPTTSTSSPGSGSSTTAGGGSGTGGSSCLAGSWVLDDEDLIDQVFADALANDEIPYTEINPQGGDYITTLNANGTVEAVRQDWGFEMISSEGTVDIVINGTQTGTWEVEGNKLLLDLDAGDEFEVTATVTVEGEVIELPQAPVDLPDEAFSSSSDFTCSGDLLTITSEGVTFRFERD